MNFKIVCDVYDIFNYVPQELHVTNTDTREEITNKYWKILNIISGIACAYNINALGEYVNYCLDQLNDRNKNNS